jgi:hypothetical protein
MLSPGTEIGKYLVLDTLGSGHFGTVYKVLDRGLSVERALKVLPVADPTQFVELFEAQIQHKCSHDNCVTVNAADVAMIGPYSLGITLFRCLNNIRDWQMALATIPDLNKTLMAGTLIKDLGWQRWVPERIRKVTSKACAPVGAKRFSTVREFRQALEKLNWDLDWRRVTAFEWTTQSGPNHSARIVGRGLDTFEHLVNGRRRKAETMTFADTRGAVDHQLDFVARTTLSIA